MVTETNIRSTSLNNERRLWVQQPATHARTQTTLVLLDGEYYVERMDAAAVIADMEHDGKIPPIRVIYVSHVDGPTRWKESACNDDFARFVGVELISWAIQHEVDASNWILGGLSLTGLSAAYTALFGPRVFTRVLCQSGSFWWSENRLIRAVREKEHIPLQFRISCGSQETAEYIEHGPGLIQRSSQLASNREMRDALVDRNHTVSYEEFDGGHDTSSWRNDLERSLVALLVGIG